MINSLIDKHAKYFSDNNEKLEYMYHEYNNDFTMIINGSTQLKTEIKYEITNENKYSMLMKYILNNEITKCYTNFTYAETNEFFRCSYSRFLNYLPTKITEGVIFSHYMYNQECEYVYYDYNGHYVIELCMKEELYIIDLPIKNDEFIEYIKTFCTNYSNSNADMKNEFFDEKNFDSLRLYNKQGYQKLCKKHSGTGRYSMTCTAFDSNHFPTGILKKKH